MDPITIASVTAGAKTIGSIAATGMAFGIGFGPGLDLGRLALSKVVSSTAQAAAWAEDKCKPSKDYKTDFDGSTSSMDKNPG